MYVTYHAPPPQPIRGRRRREALRFFHPHPHPYLPLHFRSYIHLLFSYLHPPYAPSILPPSAQAKLLVPSENNVDRLVDVHEALLPPEREREALPFRTGDRGEAVFLVAVGEHEEAHERVGEEHAEDEQEEDEDYAEIREG